MNYLFINFTIYVKVQNFSFNVIIGFKTVQMIKKIGFVLKKCRLLYGSKVNVFYIMHNNIIEYTKIVIMMMMIATKNYHYLKMNA